LPIGGEPWINIVPGPSLATNLKWSISGSMTSTTPKYSTARLIKMGVLHNTRPGRRCPQVDFAELVQAEGRAEL
jgi:hypothetical protein